MGRHHPSRHDEKQWSAATLAEGGSHTDHHEHARDRADHADHAGRARSGTGNDEDDAAPKSGS